MKRATPSVADRLQAARSHLVRANVLVQGAALDIEPGEMQNLLQTVLNSVSAAQFNVRHAQDSLAAEEHGQESVPSTQDPGGGP